jgi:hypothetical protein
MKFKVGDRVVVIAEIPDWLELTGIYGTIMEQCETRYDWLVALDNKVNMMFDEEELRPVTKLERELK